MKRLIVTLFVGLIVFVSQAQDIVIKMQQDGGVYKIPCTVNGCTMKFIFDTGASSVSMSLLTAIFLMDNDYIRSTDIVGSGSSSLADGSIVDHTEIILRDIEIGGLHLKNIRATVIESLTAPLLLGQSVIQKLGKIEIEGNTLRIKRGGSEGTIYVGSTTVEGSDTEYKRLYDRAWEYYNDKVYDRACEYFKKIYDEGLEWRSIGVYIESLYKVGKYNEAYDVLKQINDFTPYTTKCVPVYKFAGCICVHLEKYDEAIIYFELDLKKRNSCMMWHDRIYDYWGLGTSYYLEERHSKSYEAYDNAFKCYARHYGISKETLREECCNKLSSKYRNEELDRLYYLVCITYYEKGCWTKEQCCCKLRALSKIGNKTAIDDIKNREYDIYTILYEPFLWWVDWYDCHCSSSY